MRSVCIYLVDQEDLRLTLISGLDGGAALNDRTDVELHARHIRCSLQFHTGLYRTIELIADLVGIAVLIGETHRR